MLKKSLYVIAAVMCAVIMMFPNTECTEIFAAEESSASEPSDDYIQETSAPSDAVTVIIVLGLFTVTFAGSAVITYRLRRKSSDIGSDKTN